MASDDRTVGFLVVVHTAATWFMVGMIWTIHLVHYPLFAEVGEATYVDFQSAHVARIGPLLALPWAIEGAAVLGLLWLAFAGGRPRLRVPALAGGAAMLVVLLISGFWSAPAHAELADGFDTVVHDRLMAANLVRAFAWTARGVIAVWIVALVWPRPAHREPDAADPAGRRFTEARPST
jgi:hypothetical protein